MSTNFRLAPPVTVVDGLTAVPIDIQTITAVLTFDGASQTAEGDATVVFTTGPQNGCPVFDLRQTILEAWLDGASLAPALLGYHDFGGGSLAEMRVVASALPASSVHTLRVRYSLGIPQASTAGSYQPHLSWSSGPRLTFNFGFTDLGPGRYLEAWVPANLIFDQFALTLELRIVNSTVAHDLITNGTVTVLGSNHWRAQWPASITAFSPLVELRSADSLKRASDTVTLPVSGSVVTIEACKLISSTVDLPAQVVNIKNHLIANEGDVGPYVHGNRFVALVNAGGMEYDGGTTTGTGALRHETFHSWWGRGIKPASQPDAWWDEAWTEYDMAGAGASVPLDFSDAPVELCTRNAWSRVTAGNAYTAGESLFEGLAAICGINTLRDCMGAFYARHRGAPVTTAEMEAFLLSRTGKPLIVDAFHRFAYGFSEPSPAPDLWLRDDPAHTGSDPWGGAFWDSPDLWVRRREDDGTDHQDPEYGQDNWFYARVRNRSTTAAARHFVVTFNAKPFAGVQFSYPGDFLPCTAAVAGFDLGPGEVRVVKARWPKEIIPPPGSHPCLLASIVTRGEQPSLGAHVFTHNNLAQKNLTIVDLLPGDWFVLPFVLSNERRRRFPWLELRLIRPAGFERLETELLHPHPEVLSKWPFASQALWRKAPRPDQAERPEMEARGVALDCAGAEDRHGSPIGQAPWTSATPGARAARRFTEASARAFPPGPEAALRLSAPFGNPLLLGWRLHAPKDAAPGQRIRLQLVNVDWPGRKALGGCAVEIRVAQARGSIG